MGPDPGAVLQATARLRHSYFPHLLKCIPLARHWSQEVMAEEWRYPSAATEVVALLVSELSTNAIRHTPPTVGGTLRGFMVMLYAQDDAVRIELHDASDELPVLRPAAGDDEGGRGLRLVNTLSRAWGTYPRQHIGKVVWCEVAVPSDCHRSDP